MLLSLECSVENVTVKLSKSHPLSPWVAELPDGSRIEMRGSKQKVLDRVREVLSSREE